MSILLIVYSLLFLFLAWKNFRWAIFLFIVFLPTYLIRFELFNIGIYPFPSTLLEITFGLLFLVWLVRYSREDVKKILVLSKNHIWFFVAFDLFFLSSVISIFVSDMVFFSLGEWRAYFLEPMILFLILLGRSSVIPTTKEESLSGQLDNQNGQRSLGGVPILGNRGSSTAVGINPTRDDRISHPDFIWALAISTLSISIFSVIQIFTGWGIATPEWANEATRRVTAFFTSPNAVGLYLAPVLMLMVAMVLSYKEKVKDRNFWGLLVILMLALTAIFFTKSQGAWIAVGAGVLVLLFFIGYKKITIGLVVAGIIFSLILPPIREGVLFRDQAGKNRLRLWGYSWTFLKDSPKNFVLGTGVRQFFRKIQKPYYDTKVMERLIYPHSIFLNFWTEIGLLGMLAMSFILGYAIYLANKIRQHSKIIGAGLLAMLTVLVVHGLVDVPYFKNDLAFLFWILITAVFVAYVNIYQSQADGVRK